MSESNHDNLMREIERDEAWLAEVMQAYPAPACPSLANLKQRVRIAVNESAIAFDAPAVSATALAATKSAVRAELARMNAAEPAVVRRGPSWWWRNRMAVGTFAAAAAVLLVITPLWLTMSSPTTLSPGDLTASASPKPVTPNSGTQVAVSTELEDVQYALSLNATDDFDSEVEYLESEINDLYDTLTLADYEDAWEGDLDSLDDSLDDLVDELDSLEDV